MRIRESKRDEREAYEQISDKRVDYSDSSYESLGQGRAWGMRADLLLNVTVQL